MDKYGNNMEKGQYFTTRGFAVVLAICLFGITSGLFNPERALAVTTGSITPDGDTNAHGISLATFTASLGSGDRLYLSADTPATASISYNCGFLGSTAEGASSNNPSGALDTLYGHGFPNPSDTHTPDSHCTTVLADGGTLYLSWLNAAQTSMTLLDTFVIDAPIEGGGGGGTTTPTTTSSYTGLNREEELAIWGVVIFLLSLQTWSYFQIKPQ